MQPPSRRKALMLLSCTATAGTAGTVPIRLDVARCDDRHRALKAAQGARRLITFIGPWNNFMKPMSCQPRAA